MRVPLRSLLHAAKRRAREVRQADALGAFRKPLENLARFSRADFFKNVHGAHGAEAVGIRCRAIEALEDPLDATTEFEGRLWPRKRIAESGLRGPFQPLQFLRSRFALRK